jgi:hypothetical protein
MRMGYSKTWLGNEMRKGYPKTRTGRSKMKMMTDSKSVQSKGIGVDCLKMHPCVP